MARSPAPIFDRMVFPDYEFHEYPKWLYGNGTTKIVYSEEEEKALPGDWYTTPGEAAKAAKAVIAPVKIGG